MGWFQGRSEIGPRALGNRSILADPRQADMKDILNERVKFREFFRPFAPSVLWECQTDYFDLDIINPYMLIVSEVNEDKRRVTLKNGKIFKERWRHMYEEENGMKLEDIHWEY